MIGDVPSMIKVHVVDDTGHEYGRLEINLAQLERGVRDVLANGTPHERTFAARDLSSIGDGASDIVWKAVSEALKKRGLK
jgi:hypothetical protein